MFPTTTWPSRYSHSISWKLMPFPMASRMSMRLSLNPSSSFSCSSTKAAISWSVPSCEKGCTSQSRPVTASLRVCSWENRWVSLLSISSNSSICRKGSPASASLNIRASFTGVRPSDG